MTTPTPTPTTRETPLTDIDLDELHVTGVHSDEGTIVVLTTAEGVLFACDRRPALDIIGALFTQGEPIPVAIESWQIVGRV